jgi:histidinol dehydrogenase
MTVKLATWSELDDAERSALLQRPAIKNDDAIREGAAEIIAQVRRRGDAALRELTATSRRQRGN